MKHEDRISISPFPIFASTASSVESLVAAIIDGTGSNDDGSTKGHQIISQN